MWLLLQTNPARDGCNGHLQMFSTVAPIMRAQLILQNSVKFVHGPVCERQRHASIWPRFYRVAVGFRHLNFRPVKSRAAGLARIKLVAPVSMSR